MAQLTLTPANLVMLRDALEVMAPDTASEREEKNLLQLYIECKLDEEEHKS